jgi:predicted nuclease of restriction endonuclease-like RecB superfamily
LTYGRKNLKLEFRSGKAKPFYLDPEGDRELIGNVIEFYRANEGKKLGDIDWEELRIVVGDDKLYKAFRKVMSYFYKAQQPKNPPIDPKILRLKVFQFVNTYFGGYITQEKRDEFLEKIRKELKLDIDIDEILWSDDINEQILTKVIEPSVEKVVKIFNFETIDTVCVNSSRITIDIAKNEKNLGNIVKIVGRFSKLYGLVYDMRYHGNILRIIVEGPRSLFRRPTAYGSRLSLLISKILGMLYLSRYWSIEASMHTSKKVLEIELLSYRFKPLIDTDRQVYVKQIFDSSIEESIYRVLKSLGIDVRREEEPIALGSLVYLPDFKIYKDGREFYIEVAGYWRKEYAEKKAYKLYEISKILKNLIVIADEKLEPYFKKLRIPIIYYTLVYGKPVLPYKKILDIINNKE